MARRKASVQTTGVLQGRHDGEGDFVLQTQKVGTEMGFRNVSQHWLNTGTFDFQEGLRRLEEGKAQIEDFRVPLCTFQPGVKDNGQFVLHHQDGRDYTPTVYALEQLAVIAGCSTWQAATLFSPVVDKQTGKITRQRDRQDSETLQRLLTNGLRHLDQTKEMLFRTQKDGTMRAVLSKRYAILDNRWFVHVLADVLPNGRFSHWKDDGDKSSLYANVLIPDSLRDGGDSAYGAMISVGNSEIGRRKLSWLPSIFRSICMNGCIWGQVVGKKVNQIHKGNIDLVTLRQVIRSTINEQIPLVPTLIDTLLGTRKFAWDGATARPVFAALGGKLNLSKRENTEVLSAWSEEATAVPDTAKTAFAVINAVTRSGRGKASVESGQDVRSDVWVDRDLAGGKLLSWDKDDWSNLFSSAKKMKKEEVEEAFLMPN